MNDVNWGAITSNVLELNGIPMLSNFKVPEGSPDVENQISEAENEWIKGYFRQFHIPMMSLAGISVDDLRILEVGGGFGQLAYGTFHSARPIFYIATDIFPQLATSMDEGFKKWGAKNFAAALLDPNQEPFLIHDGAFNVVQSHSVLHHILNYEEAVARLYKILDSPGVMIFCEPCLDAYVYLQTLTKSFRQVFSVSEPLKSQLHYLDVYVDQRCGSSRHDKEFLAQFGSGDKYLYSLYDLQRLAEKIGAKFHVEKDTRGARENFKHELKIRNASSHDLERFDEFLKEVLPAGVDDAYFSDLRQVFCFCKK